MVIADAICDVAKDIGARRGKPNHIPQWVMVSDIAGLLDGPTAPVSLTLSCRRRSRWRGDRFVLQVEGEPVYSIAPFQGWDETGRPVKIRLR